MRVLLFICLWLPGTMLFGQKEPDCQDMLRQAKAFERDTQLSKAVQFYLNALNCNSGLGSEIGPRLKGVFGKIEEQKRTEEVARKEAVVQRDNARREKENAERGRRKAYADDLAYKSTIALRDGDRTAAFRLAEFAYRYVDDDNLNVTKALVEAIYYNENPDHHPLLWKETILNGQAYALWSVAFAPDGKKVAIRAFDNTAKIWDLESGKDILTLKHTYRISSVAFSQDGKKIATHSIDNITKIWDLQSGKDILILKGHTDEFIRFAFSPDGEKLATSSIDNTTKIWDLQSGKDVLTLSTSFSSVAFSPDGKRLATGSYDNTVKIWDLQSGKDILTLSGHTGGITSVAFSPDGKRVATGSYDNTAKIWDLESCKDMLTLKGHSSYVNRVAFSPDGEKLATDSADNTTKIWDLRSGINILMLQGQWLLTFSPNGKKLATRSIDNTVTIWDLELSKDILTFNGYSGEVWNVAFSPDGKKLATASGNNTAKIWDLKSDTSILTINANVRQVAFSPDGKKLATGSIDKTAKIWELESGKTILTLNGHTAGITSIAFSPDGKKLVTGAIDNTTRIWDLQCGAAILTLNVDVSSVAFSPDGKKLATGSSDNTAKVWDLQSGKNILTLNGHTAIVWSVAFSPDGKKLATGSSDKTVKIWDLQSGKDILTLNGHTADVNSVAFSPDGKKISSGAFDKTAKIWDLQSGKEIITLNGHTNFVMSVAFSPDGTKLATGSYDGTVKIWEFTAQGWLASPVGKRPLACLIFSQLNAYNLSGLLDIRPDNEAVLRQSMNPQQIAAFAELFDLNTRNSRDLRRTASDFARAARLYGYALGSGGDSDLVKNLGNLYLRWAEDILASNRPDTASWYMERVCRICQDISQCPKLWLDYSKKTGKSFDLQYFLASEDAEELQKYGNLYFMDTLTWDKAKQLYEKAEGKKHISAVLENLFAISEKTGEAFDLKRFLISEDAEELGEYAGFFAHQREILDENQQKKPGYSITIRLLDKQLTLDTTSDTRISVANKYDNLSHQMIFLSKGKDAEVFIRRGLELDPTNKYLPINLPPALLLQGRFEEAKVEYLKWSPKPYGAQDLPTYRDAFLSEFDDFYDKDLVIPRIQEIKTLLKSLDIKTNDKN